MNRLLFSAVLSFLWLYACGQGQTRTLSAYIETAKQNSPLLNDYRNRIESERAELDRLKAMYRHSRLEVNGDYLFVPIISSDGGRTSFRWNAQDASDYYGYDLGESSGHLHAGMTWIQPLLGNSSYKAAREQSRINTEIARNNIRIEKHQIERLVTEQYLLCMLDQAQISYADSIGALILRQDKIVRRLVENGMARKSDLELLAIEQEANTGLRLSYLQSYRTHLTDLNLMCGISDTTDIVLTDIDIRLNPAHEGGESLFTEQYRLDSMATAASLRSFRLQYRPKLDLFVNGGLQTGSLHGIYRHFGWSAGLTFTWTIFDGKQRRYKEYQAELQQRSIRAYMDNAEYRRRIRLGQCLSEIEKYGIRMEAVERQLAGYDSVLSVYAKEIQAGQMSVLDYITVLRNRIQAEKDRMLLQTNMKLAIAAYNYWNH